MVSTAREDENAGHGRHAAGPDSTLIVPSLHALQGPPFGPVNPGIHSHIDALFAPDGSMLLTGHVNLEPCVLRLLPTSLLTSNCECDLKLFATLLECMDPVTQSTRVPYSSRHVCNIGAERFCTSRRRGRDMYAASFEPSEDEIARTGMTLSSN